MADSSSLKASNISVPLTNDDRIIGDKSPLKTNYPTTTNICLSSDNVLMSNGSMEENHPHDNDDFQDRLTKLRKEHEERMKQYDNKIQYFQTKINKVCKQIEKMNRDMKNVMIKKEEKQQEFLNIFNEHVRLPKTNKSHEKGQTKNIKRIQGGISGGRRK